jgi:hypothetical protein
MGRLLASIALLCVLGAGHPASAHDVHGEVIFVDVGERVVDLELEVPLFQLALARQQSIDALAAAPTEQLAGDARALVSLRDAEGAPFLPEVRRIGVVQHSGAQVMRFELRFTPPPGSPARWFELSDELVLRRVVTANVYVFLRRDLAAGAFGDSPTLLGSLHYQQRQLIVDRTSGEWSTGLAAAFRLGLDHTREGTDHLLFLLMLLVVAPLAHAGRAWSSATTLRRGLARTAGIATAFTLGHSLTLALGALGGVTLPSRLVESAIAVSILVTAIHAWRPLFAGKEAVVAAAFGLVHGLAFATALHGLGFDRPTLALALLGFNLGVEAMQLAVIALVVPSLMLLARGPAYPILRYVAASITAGASLTWLIERSLETTTPISPLLDRAAHHSAWLAVVLATMAVVSFIAGRLVADRRPAPGRVASIEL